VPYFANSYFGNRPRNHYFLFAIGCTPGAEPSEDFVDALKTFCGVFQKSEPVAFGSSQGDE